MKNENKKSKVNVRVLAGCGMLSAAAIALQYLEFPLAFIIPSFIKFDFSDLPALIGAFAYGPLAGVVIALVKNLIHMAISQSGYVGELSNFLLCAVFSCVAGIVYKKYNTKKGALIAGIIGAVCMAAISFPINKFIVYPFYYNFMAKEAVLGAYQVIMPFIKNMDEALLISNVPFTLIKGLSCVGISMLIYKPLSLVLHGKR